MEEVLTQHPRAGREHGQKASRRGHRRRHGHDRCRRVRHAIRQRSRACGPHPEDTETSDAPDRDLQLLEAGKPEEVQQDGGQRRHGTLRSGSVPERRPRQHPTTVTEKLVGATSSGRNSALKSVACRRPQRTLYRDPIPLLWPFGIHLDVVTFLFAVTLLLALAPLVQPVDAATGAAGACEASPDGAAEVESVQPGQHARLGSCKHPAASERPGTDAAETGVGALVEAAQQRARAVAGPRPAGVQQGNDGQAAGRADLSLCRVAARRCGHQQLLPRDGRGFHGFGVGVRRQRQGVADEERLGHYAAGGARDGEPRQGDGGD